MNKRILNQEGVGAEYVAPMSEIAEISVEHGFEYSVHDPYSMDLEDYATGSFKW